MTSSDVDQHLVGPSERPDDPTDAPHRRVDPTHAPVSHGHGVGAVAVHQGMVVPNKRVHPGRQPTDDQF